MRMKRGCLKTGAAFFCSFQNNQKVYLLFIRGIRNFAANTK